ncbi:MAG TPA: aldo/keto reductase [Burkholderiales bacterium]|nr:aldo/keto reductase [Burkholderiales bacterium]
MTRRRDENAMKPVAAAGAIRLGDLTVNRLGLGTMRVCGPQVWGEPRDRDIAIALLRRAYDLGHTFFDTADSYGPHVSELLIAEALYPYPKDLVIATKGGLLRPQPERWDECGTPKHLRAAVEGSLKRLRVERIDLYQLHAPDPNVPLAESMEALVALQRAGKIGHIGVSNVDAKELAEARGIATIVSVQNQYALGNRSDEDILLACEAASIAFIPWYPLGAGKALKAQNVRKVAARLGVAPSQVVLAWLLAHSPVMLPIPGTGSIEHLEENAAAAHVRLLEEDLADLA